MKKFIIGSIMTVSATYIAPTLSGLDTSFLAFAQTLEGATQSGDSIRVGQQLYVAVESLNVRSQGSTTANIIGQLNPNDVVEIVDASDNLDQFVQIVLLKTTGEINFSSRMFVAKKFLSPTPVKVAPKQESKYFVVQNVATEVTRVYEKCDKATEGENCTHRMILEEDMVVGRRTRDNDEAKKWFTWLGTYKITQWHKFYQDGEFHYPSWYDPNFPSVPKPNSSFKSWFSKDVMPKPGYNVMRGAFGWFAAFTGPNSNSQWMHGTAGWGADGDKFIKVTRNALVNMIKDARSSGCTRVENGLIAYLRHILPVGTPIMRVYAWEAYEDARLSRYESQRHNAYFDYILTKEAVRKNGPSIERYEVISRGVPASEYLEEGRYEIDQYPTIRRYKVAPLYLGSGTGSNGNVYRVPKKKFRGIYLVDSGTFINYQHPEGLPTGGIMGLTIYPFSISKATNFSTKGHQEIEDDASPRVAKSQ